MNIKPIPFSWGLWRLRGFSADRNWSCGKVSAQSSVTPKSAIGAGARSDQIETVRSVNITAISRKTSLEPVESFQGLSTGSITNAALSEDTGTSGVLLRVNADNVRMRSAPSPGAADVAIYPRGTTLQAIGQSGNWFGVRHIKEGVAGWMFADYLSQVQ